MERLGFRVRDISALVAVGVGVVVLSLAIIAFVGSAGFGYDYAAYDAAARRIVAGSGLYVGDTARLYAEGKFEGLYLYPPPLAIALTPLTLLSTADATLVWMLLRVAILAGACAILPVSRVTRMLVFAVACFSFPVLFDLNIGNISLVALAVTALAWRTSGTALASVAHAVLVAMRFPFGVYFLQWLVQRRWHPIAGTVVAGVALILASLPIVGIETYLEYVTILRGLPDISTGLHNLSLKSTTLAMGFPIGVASLAVPASYVVGVAAIVFAARRRDPDIAFVVTATATLLVTPFIHPHYLVMLVLPAALLVDRGQPLALGLPLLGWLPDPALPLVGPVTLAWLLLAPHRGTVATASGSEKRRPALPT